MNTGCRAEPECCQAAGYNAGTDPDVDEMVFAVIGDYGNRSSDTGGVVGKEAVADLVKSWDPEYICTNGDNWYGSSSTQSDWEARAASIYRNYIYPYIGAESSSASHSNFYPGTGNHDRDPVGHKQSFSWFNYPQVYRNGSWQASTGYYSVRRGIVEHFFYDSGYDSSQVNQQADGNDLLSAQAIWLQTSLAASNARWKIVHCHHPGYTSFESAASQPTLVGNGYLAYTAIRNLTNVLRGWGADVLFHGHIHNYERLNVGGLPVLVNGAGGREIEDFGTPIDESIYRFEGFGAHKGTATCERLTLEFFDADGVLKDTLILTKS